ncbi:MAG: ABC transporter ATP-binding protein [Streptosporangiaceae bacterium]|nr:ABC transporter ATP-binding protein [Streptosporangiaceae bacterium]MBV9854516.1 ABC transporter ATP-binding protein [Streptosporangiaceae bacterium]
MTGLSVEGLHKSYPGTPVLRGIGLQVKSGTLTAILGASGSGKTTLLRVITGFEAADRGSVSVNGTVVDDGRHRVRPEQRHIGLVPQDGALFPHLTVRANVAFPLARRDRHGRRPDEMLELVGLGDLASRYPHQLSGGQQQRVALARALASQPSLILLDEPFSSLDAGLRATVRTDVLAVLRATGTTTVLVTHDQDEALSAADHVAVLRDGRIIQADTPRQLYRCPADPQLASFVGTANLLEGTWDGKRVTTALGRHGIHAGLQVPKPGHVTVLIRPEQICLTPPGSDTVPARVTATHYYGHDALVAVRPDAPGSRPGNGKAVKGAPGNGGLDGAVLDGAVLDRGALGGGLDGGALGGAVLGCGNGGPGGVQGGGEELRVRVSRSDPPEPGEFVSLTVRGSVAAWAAADGN